MRIHYFLSLPIFLLSLAHAEISSIACPAANSLKFTSIAPNQYEVQGVADVLSGGLPAFRLYGRSTVQSATDFKWDRYNRRNQIGEREFICSYESLNYEGQKVEFSIKAINAEWTEWCSIDGLDKSFCQGDRLNCLLRCEIL